MEGKAGEQGSRLGVRARVVVEAAVALDRIRPNRRGQKRLAACKSPEIGVLPEQDIHLSARLGCQPIVRNGRDHTVSHAIPSRSRPGEKKHREQSKGAHVFIVPRASSIVQPAAAPRA